MCRHQYFSILGCSCWWWKDWTSLSEPELKERNGKPWTGTGEADRNRVVKARLRRIRPDMEQSRLRHEKALLHTSVKTTAAIRLLDFTVLEQPAYLQHWLGASDIHHIPKRKDHLGGNHHVLASEVKRAVDFYFLLQTHNYLVTKLRNDFEVGERMYTAKVIMWRNQCIEVNKV